MDGNAAKVIETEHTVHLLRVIGLYSESICSDIKQSRLAMKFVGEAVGYEHQIIDVVIRMQMLTCIFH